MIDDDEIASPDGFERMVSTAGGPPAPIWSAGPVWPDFHDDINAAFAGRHPLRSRRLFRRAARWPGDLWAAGQTA